MEPEVNLLGVFLGAVSALIVGSIWYSKKVFGASWMELAHIDEAKAKSGALRAIGGMFILALVMAFVLSHVAYMSKSVFGYSFQAAALSSAFWMWLGFVLPAMLGNGLFEQKPKKLSLINLGNWLVTMLVMGAVIGYIGM